jgi:hypothetical protein
MEELIVEGLTEEDFILLEKILKAHNISINSDVSFDDLKELYAKVKQITDYLT